MKTVTKTVPPTTVVMETGPSVMETGPSVMKTVPSATAVKTTGPPVMKTVPTATTVTKDSLTGHSGDKESPTSYKNDSIIEITPTDLIARIGR